MPKFQYTARNLSGGKVSGNVEAEGEIAAARLLENRELFPIDVWSPEAGEAPPRSGAASPRATLA